jgi:hypothetical protein
MNSESSQASIAVSRLAGQDARDQSEYPRHARFYAIEISEFGKSQSPRDLSLCPPRNISRLEFWSISGTLNKIGSSED